MKKYFYILFFGLIFTNYIPAQTVNNYLVIEVNNAVVNGGIVGVAFFSSAESFRREQPDYFFEFEPVSATLTRIFPLPAGEYVISAYQDANGNGIVDFGLFGIPKELVGVTNYFGRGFPSRNFDRQKILIDRTTIKVSINLYSF